MLLLFFLLLALLQIISYMLMDKYHVLYGRTMVLIVLLGGHLLIFPALPDARPATGEGPDCGLVTAARYLVFWILGGGSSLLTHGLYFLLYRRRNNSHHPRN